MKLSLLSMKENEIRLTTTAQSCVFMITEPARYMNSHLLSTNEAAISDSYRDPVICAVRFMSTRDSS